MVQARTPKIRRDGWTPERQLRFLDAFAQTRSVTRAATVAGMSRESAYRLRARSQGSLFAALWDRLHGPPPGPSEAHAGALSDGRLARLLGNYYRRESGEFSRIGSVAGKPLRS